MLTTVKGIYNGDDFVFDLDENIHLSTGQEVFLVLTDNVRPAEKKERKHIDFSKFVGLGEKLLPETDARDHVRELREN